MRASTQSVTKTSCSGSNVRTVSRSSVAWCPESGATSSTLGSDFAAERARGAAQCPLQPIGQSRLEAEEWHEFPQAARRHPGLVDPADVALLHLMQQPGEGLALRS